MSQLLNMKATHSNVDSLLKTGNTHSQFHLGLRLMKLKTHSLELKTTTGAAVVCQNRSRFVIVRMLVPLLSQSNLV
jgi:hypothetical protein